MDAPGAPTPPPEQPGPEGPTGTFRQISERLRSLSPGLFGVVVLCFFLPFVSVMCTGVTLITMKGSDFVFGGTVEVNDDIEKSFEDSFDLGPLGDLSDEASEDATTDELPETEDVDPNVLAIIAFGSAIAGVIVGLVLRGTRRDLILAGIAASLFAALLLFRFDVGGDTQGAPVQIEFRYGWWTSLVIALALGIAHWQAHRARGPSPDSLRTDHGPPPGP